MMDVLEKRGSDNIDRRLLLHLLDADVDNPSESGILALKKLGDGEEKLSPFIRGEVFSLIEEIDKIGERANALFGVELGIMKTPGIIHS